jgi:hypothetical protein
VIHPIASPSEVERFLELMNWSNIADIPFDIQHSMQGMTFSLFSKDLIVIKH